MRSTKLARSGVAVMCAAAGLTSVQAVAPAAAMTFAPASTAQADSADWAGWDVTGGTYTSVSAHWTQPAVSCTSAAVAAGEETSSAFWVGLDGDGSTSVEQTGTQANCESGRAQYNAWYEFYPAAAVNLTGTVRAGDHLTASVTYHASTGAYTVVVADTTQGWTRTEHGAVAAGTNASAEVIAEAPTDSATDEIAPLSDFGTVHFTDVKVDGHAIGTVASAKKITMGAGDETMASTSALSSADQFSVTWQSAGDSALGSTGGLATGSGKGWPYGSGSAGGGSTGGGSAGGSGWPYGSGSGSGDGWPYGSGSGSGDGWPYGSGSASGGWSGYGWAAYGW